MQSEEGHTNRDLKHTRTAMSTSGGNKKYFFIILVFCEHIFYLLKLLVFIFGKNPCTRRLFLNEKTDVSCLNQCSARFEYCVEREQLTAQMSPSASHFRRRPRLFFLYSLFLYSLFLANHLLARPPKKASCNLLTYHCRDHEH